MRNCLLGKGEFLILYIKCIIFRRKLVCFVFPLAMPVLCSCGERTFDPLYIAASALQWQSAVGWKADRAENIKTDRLADSCSFMIVDKL